MKHTLPNRIISLLLAVLAVFALAAGAFAGARRAPEVSVSAVVNGCVIRSSVTDGGLYLFLPAAADFTALPVKTESDVPVETVAFEGSLSRCDGTPEETVLDLPALCGTQDPYALELVCGGLRTELTVMRTSPISAMYLTSDDPVNQGRAWVEESPDKTNKATGSMKLLAPDGSTVYDGALTQIKGRGNSTWAGEKKPYQIKLSKKTDLLQTGVKANANKTWVLLANYYDPTLLHNTVAYSLACAMRMGACVQSEPVDLYYDGEYRGVYLLCEKVAADSGRVEIADLDKANEDANPDAVFDALFPEYGVTENGAVYKYYPDLVSPADVTGGYLIEADYESRAKKEASWFRTSRGYYFTVKTPEYGTQAEMDYIASLYQRYEDALFRGESVAAFCDVTSLAQCYLLNELSKNPDGWTTSAYFYKDAGDGLLHAGPVWDYDLAFGEGSFSTKEDAAAATGFYTLYDVRMKQLYAQPQFRDEVRTVYCGTLYPLLRDVLFGGKDAVSEDGELCSLEYLKTVLADSAACNFVLWPESNPSSYSTHPGGETHASNLEFFCAFLAERAEWLYEQYSGWSAEEFEKIGFFHDVKGTEWYAPFAERAAELGLISGTGHSTFDAAAPVTRAMAVQVLFRLAGGEDTETVLPFPDTPAEQWYAPALRWAYSRRIIAGYPDGRFRPNADVTRQDFALMLWLLAGTPEADVSVLSARKDGAAVAPYARSAVAWAVTAEIMTGDDYGRLLPKSSCTRAELAVLVCGVFDYLN